MKKLLIAFCLAFSFNQVYADYCVSSSRNASYEWINRIAVGPIDQSSASSKYSLFNTSETLELNTGYPVMLTPGYSSYSYTEHWMIWVDLNQDQTFSDEERLVYNTGTGLLTDTLTLPHGLPGETRMRVTMAYGNAVGPCASFTYGEVEDYTITIGDPTISLDPAVESISPFEDSTLPVSGAELKITFNKLMDASTLTESSFSLSGTGSSYAVYVSDYDAQTNSLTVMSNEVFEYDDSVTLLVKNTITDTNGTAIEATSYQFNTEADPALAPFTLNSTNIPEGIDPTTPIKLTFNAQVNQASATTTSITIVNSETSMPATIDSFSFENDGLTLVIPTHSLVYTTNYSLKIEGLLNVYGAELDLTTLGFTTSEPPASYCDSQGKNGSPGISSVSIGSKTFSVTNHYAYSDRSESPATIDSMLYTQITVDAYKGSNYPMYYGIWIDWNDDKEFYASENVKHITTSDNSFSFYFKPPAGIEEGSYRMRLAARLQSTAFPCGDLGHGATMDFTVNVVDQ